MAALPYIQLYVADYLADTQHLSLEEHGAYLLLIFNYWQRGKAPTDDNQRFASICSTSVERWLEIRSTLVEFFVVENGLWVHKRIEKDLEKVYRKSKQAVMAGKASAAKRSLKTGDENGRSISVERKGNHTDTDTDTEKKNKRKKHFDFISFRPSFFPEKLWLAFIENRKFKKLENSELALNTACKQFEKAVSNGFSIETCVGAFCEGKWTRFKAEWMENIQRTGKQTIVDEKAARARQLLGGMRNDEAGNSCMGVPMGPDYAGKSFTGPTERDNGHLLGPLRINEP